MKAVGPGQTVSTLVAGRHLQLTNLDKVLYPADGTTKAQLIEYLVTVSEPLLNQLAGRIVTRRRWPDGVTQPSFFEKALPKGSPNWLAHVGIRRMGDQDAAGTDSYTGYIDYPILLGQPADVAALVWFAQLCALELHTPQWRVSSRRAQFGQVGPADRVVLDLDPGPPAGLAECCQVALLAREIVAGAGLPDPVPVASGSKGMHLYIRLDPPLPAGQAGQIADTIGAALGKLLPDLVVRRMTRELRPGRVFIDVAQNVAARTTLAPYSPRGTPLPNVATPLLWEEVASGEAAPATIHSLPDRLARLGDLFLKSDGT